MNQSTNTFSPIVLVVMDGVGIGSGGPGDAVKNAFTPTLDKLLKDYPNTFLRAHGTAVGLPSDDDMGNSEVGHNALGCGQIYAQGAMLVNQSIENGSMFRSEAWVQITDNCVQNNSTLHFIGLLSDGNVHSNIAHLKAMLMQAKQEKLKKVRVHILLDGRDVPATSALQYINELETLLSELNSVDFDAKIASGGGRMKVTMDRYQADWNMVKTGWDTHVRGIGRQFASASEAVKTYREELNVIDQDLPAFVIAENGEAVGTIDDNDSVILFNFRGDRAIEISMAFDYADFAFFDRFKVPNVIFAGMLQYDGDLRLPKRFLVTPPHITNTLTELCIKNKIKQYAVSETQKFGHVTYFWNGNKSGKTSDEYEDFCEITSDLVPFDQRPWMKSAEVTDKVIEAVESGKYGFIRCNFPNGDMVGHTGSMQPVLVAVEAVDIALERIIKAVDKTDAILLITADHGNADDMLEKSKSGELSPKTAHSLNPVPFIIYSRDKLDIKLKQSDSGQYGLANVAPTIAELLGLEAPDCWEESLID